MILVACLGLALALGMLSGGRLRLLREVQIKGELCLAAMLVLEVASPALATQLGLSRTMAIVLWCLELVVAASVCMWNLNLRGMWLAAIGLCLNAVVVIANLGMPVDSYAYSRWGGGSSLVISAADRLHVVLGAGSRLAALSDVLAFPAPRPLSSLVSAGDVLLLVGVAVLLSSSLVAEQQR